MVRVRPGTVRVSLVRNVLITSLMTFNDPMTTNDPITI
jgi:hypothetical protein